MVTLQWSTAESTVFHKWLDVAGEHHLMSHDAVGNREDLINIGICTPSDSTSYSTP